MWNLGRAIRIFAPALLVAVSAATLSGPAQAGQIGAVKDGWLVMKVHSEMVDEDVLNGSNIDVDAKNGVVTLQGTVPSEAARARAVAVAKANDGVKSVVDRLRIAPPTRRRRRAGGKGWRQGRGRRGEDRRQDGQRGEQDGPRDRRRLDQVEDLRAVPDRLEHRARRQRHRHRCQRQRRDVERQGEVRGGQGEGRGHGQVHRRREVRERHAESHGSLEAPGRVSSRDAPPSRKTSN